MVPASSPEGLLGSVQALWEGVRESEAGQIYTSPVFWGLIALIPLLERLAPARREQPAFSSAFLQDLVWFFIISAFRVTFLAAYVGLLQAGYDRFLSWMTVSSAAAWPFWTRALLGILMADFLAWLHHWVRHKVPLFWNFHTVHHSQQRMNLFTDLRYHPLEYVVTETLRLLPFFMLGAALPTILVYEMFHQWWTKFYHGNIRSNCGWLRYVLVTPQSHRIHHSVDPRHRDTNFGVVFSIWDRLLGTQHADSDGYPDTGVDDPSFPMESSAQPRGILASTWGQLVYPFRLLRRSA